MTPAELAARAERLEGLLRAYGNVQNNYIPTEAELWAGCKDAADLLRDLRAEMGKSLDRERALSLGVVKAAQELNLDESELAALRARHEELRRDFAEYADHGLDDKGRSCPKGTLADDGLYVRPRPGATPPPTACTCGLAEARAKWGGT